MVKVLAQKCQPNQRPLKIGKGRIIREGKSIAILSIGTRLADAMKAADNLSNMGINCTVADARFAKPVDTDLVHKLAEEHDLLVTVEEGSIGGFSTQVMDYLVRNGSDPRSENP